MKRILPVIIYILSLVFIVKDLITLMKGATFTPVGIATFIVAVGIGCIAEDYIRGN